MFNGTKVLDVHGHVSGPPGTVSWIDMGFASGHVGESPFRTGNRPANLSDELMYERNKYHVDFMDDRNIDVQVIGPRPFRMMGWMPRTCSSDGVSSPRHHPPPDPELPGQVPVHHHAAADRGGPGPKQLCR